MMHAYRYLWVVVGSLFITFGSGTIALNAFRQSFPPVFLGVLIWVIGYKIAQDAEREEWVEQGRMAPFSRVAPTSNDWLAYARPTRFRLLLQEEFIVLANIGLALTGLAAMSYSFMLLAQAVDTASFMVGGGGAALLFIGYMTGHVAINNSLV